jgi:hypothetical protein
LARALAAMALVLAACSGTANEAGHSDAGADGAGALSGFDPFGDASSAGGCDGGVDAEPAPDAADPECATVGAAVGYQQDVIPILNGCTGELCHSAPTWSTLVGQPSHECCSGRSLVAPGRPSDSYLVDKLRGQNLCGGVRMPAGDPALPASDIDVIVSWICEGAPAS